MRLKKFEAFVTVQGKERAVLYGETGRGLEQGLTIFGITARQAAAFLALIDADFSEFAKKCEGDDPEDLISRPPPNVDLHVMFDPNNKAHVRPSWPPHRAQVPLEVLNAARLRDVVAWVMQQPHNCPTLAEAVEALKGTVPVVDKVSDLKQRVAETEALLRQA